MGFKVSSARPPPASRRYLCRPFLGCTVIVEEEEGGENWGKKEGGGGIVHFPSVRPSFAVSRDRPRSWPCMCTEQSSSSLTKRGGRERNLLCITVRRHCSVELYCTVQGHMRGQYNFFCVEKAFWPCCILYRKKSLFRRRLLRGKLMFSKVTLSCYQNIPQKPPCDIHSLTNCSLTFHTVNYPTNHSIRRTYLYRFCVLTFLYFLISFLGCKNGIKNENLALFLLFGRHRFCPLSAL